MAQRRKQKVLLVEDEKSLIAMYQFAFEKSAFDLHVASTGDEALQIIANNHPDIILLDIFLPENENIGMDFSKHEGLDVLESLRKNVEVSAIPVIILTNLDSPESRKRAAQLGAHEYILKTNILPKDIVKKVEELLAKK